MNFRGIFPPICTAFQPDGSLALQAFRRNIERYNAAPLHGYVVTGSTGEAVMLTETEKLQVWEAARQAAVSDRLMIAGTASQSTKETIALTAAAAEQGYDAALVLTPYFFKAQMLQPAAQRDFFHAVADAARVPVILYNFPQMTGIDLSVDAMSDIVQHPNIVAVKESSADIKKIEQLGKALPAEIQLLVGAAAHFDTCLRFGAVGGILGIANALPVAMCRILECFIAGQEEGTTAAQNVVRKAAGVSPKYGIQGLKHAMEVCGFYGGPCRSPLPPLTEDAKHEIEELFAEFKTE